MKPDASTNRQTGGSLWVLGALHLNIGHTFTRQQKLAEAVDELQMVQAYFEQAQLRDLLPELYGLLAEVAWLQGDLETAVAQGQQSLELAHELSMSREEGHNLRILGEIARSQEHFTEAKQFFLESYTILTQADDEYEQGKTQLSLAQLYASQDRRAEAETALANSEAIFACLEAQLDLEVVVAVRYNLTK